MPSDWPNARPDPGPTLAAFLPDAPGFGYLALGIYTILTTLPEYGRATRPTACTPARKQRCISRVCTYSSR